MHACRPLSFCCGKTAVEPYSSQRTPMPLFMLPPKMSCRATLVLHLFISILVAKAWGFRNLRRVDPELTCADNWLHWAGDMAPGAGFEFESEDVQFESSMCSRLDESYTRALIRHVVIGHSGTNWDLTVDAPFHTPGQLVAEIILDGLSLKIHTEDAEAAGLAAVEDMVKLSDHLFHRWLRCLNWLNGGSFTLK